MGRSTAAASFGSAGDAPRRRCTQHSKKSGFLQVQRGRRQSAGCRAFPVAQSRALPDGRAHGFAALANIGVLRAGRAQHLYLLTPPGRFALRATAHRADASLRRAAGRFGPSAQVPTGHALPFAPAGVWGSAPKSYAAAHFVSVASARRAQETRRSPKSRFFQDSVR